MRVQPIWLSPVLIVSIDSEQDQNTVANMEMPGMAALPSQHKTTPSKDDPAVVRNASGPRPTQLSARSLRTDFS